MIEANLAWSKETFSLCKLGDKRLVDRLIHVAGHLSTKVGSCLSSCFSGNNTDTVGAYRLIRNDSVKPESIMDGVFQSTAQKMADNSCVVALEDTTSLSYTHSVRKELGYLGNRNTEHSPKGFQAHTVILYDMKKKRLLGIIEQQRWKRDNDNFGKKHDRKKRQYEEKESYKWELCSRNMSRTLGEKMNCVISVCDREADIFAYLDYKKSNNQRFVVRAAQDRLLYDTSDGHISSAIQESNRLGTFEVGVTQKGGRKARKAKVDIRACTVELNVPETCDHTSAGYLEINVVSVTELTAPEGQKALSWVLLTTEPVENFEQARKVVEYYEKRWLIEEYHKCWKSGVSVEKLRMQFADNLERMIVILAPIALRLLQLRENLDEECKEKTCLSVLSEEEFIVLWKSIEKKKRMPKTPPSLEWAYKSIAKLGGWGDSKNTGKACWSKIWEGWYLLGERVEGYILACQ